MLHTNEDNFQENVLDKHFVVVDFYADWCGPCRMISPFLEAIEAEMGIEIAKVDIDEASRIAAKYEVMSIPTVMIFKDGNKVAENVGAASKARLAEWIQKHF